MRKFIDNSSAGGRIYRHTGLMDWISLRRENQTAAKWRKNNIPPERITVIKKELAPVSRLQKYRLSFIAIRRFHAFLREISSSAKHLSLDAEDRRNASDSRGVVSRELSICRPSERN